METHEQDTFAKPISIGENQWLEYQRVVYDLKSHQIELEMQNEELRNTEAKLRETSKRFADLYDFAPIAYLTMTGRGVIQELNLKATSLLDRPRIFSVGTTFDQYVVDQDRPAFIQHLRSTLIASQSTRCSLRLRHESGRIIDVDLESSAWWDERQGRTFIRSIISDVSKWKAMEKELKAERDRAEAASRSKSQFLANMSHEMRSPLGIIIGFTELLIEQNGDNPEEVDHRLRTIQRQGIHLLSLIDDLLDLAKVEEGQLTLETLELDLKQELEETIEPFRRKSQEKGLTFEVE